MCKSFGVPWCLSLTSPRPCMPMTGFWHTGAKGTKAATKKQEAGAPPAKESGSEAPAKQPAKAKAAKQGGADDLMFGGLVVRGPAAESLRSRGIMRATTIQEAAMVKIMRGAALEGRGWARGSGG